MEDIPVQPGSTQADFIQNELNFDIDPKDPMTNADLKDPVENEWTDILMNGQLRRKIIKLGEQSNRPNASDICTLKIIGKLEDGTVVEEHEELTIQLGDVEVIQGLDLAIALMNIGEIAEVEVGPRFGYGDIGNKPNIPGGAKIFYTVELKAIELEVDLDQLSVHQRQEIGNKKRERGNWWYMRNEPTLAIQCYRRALEYLDDTNGGISYQEKEGDQFTSDADLQGLLEDRMKVYNNLAAAQMKCDAYDSAQRSVENVLRCQPQNVKALFRKGKILHLRGEHAQAYTILQQAAKLDPESKEIQQELVILQKKNAKDAHREKNLYRKMLGTNKANGVELKKTITESKNKNVAKVAWSLIGGAAVALVGIFAYRYTS